MKLINNRFAALLILSVFVLSACKKGENDPFLSLRSRNARITGVWKLTSQQSSSSYTTTFGGSSTTDVTSYSFDGTTMTETDGGSTDSYSFSQTIEIKKEGTYKLTIVEDGTTSVTEGNWWWLDSNKKKVRIAFDDDWGSFYIDALKNKELVLTRDESESISDSGFSDSYTSTGKWEFEKE